MPVVYYSIIIYYSKNIAVRKEARPPPVRLWRCQHNGRRLSTTDSDRRTSFTTVDNAGGETTVVLGLQHLTPSRTGGRTAHIISTSLFAPKEQQAKKKQTITETTNKHYIIKVDAS